ncbi:hypothetical protein PN498_05645 [Oscillatoria sp. CS-180]|uniref:hypothetical protein n=1 Tax=Oscillatoria sp. CS-180 TaxID=3021720 RepID=UPI00232DFBB8|nr:hypothetical protein [Oscillatoria sp. CS-180]MDB9525462.1 hypothetical protein [Oscillatoria sp. CS-180]
MPNSQQAPVIASLRMTLTEPLRPLLPFFILMNSVGCLRTALTQFVIYFMQGRPVEIRKFCMAYRYSYRQFR